MRFDFRNDLRNNENSFAFIIRYLIDFNSYDTCHMKRLIEFSVSIMEQSQTMHHGLSKNMMIIQQLDLKNYKAWHSIHHFLQVRKMLWFLQTANMTQWSGEDHFYNSVYVPSKNENQEYDFLNSRPLEKMVKFN